MLTLETERLFLRGFNLKDWDALNAIISDPEVTRFMHTSYYCRMRNAEYRICSSNAEVRYDL